MTRSIIGRDPEVMGGTAVFSGTRVPIKALFDYIETGDTVESFLDDYPGVSRVQVIGLLETVEVPVSTAVREAIHAWLGRSAGSEPSAFELGKDLFGRYDGPGALAEDRKAVHADIVASRHAKRAPRFPT